MAALSLGHSADFKTLVCGECGCEFALRAHHYDALVARRGGFHCPNGHARQFIGETEAEKLKKRLEFEQNRREAAERDRDTARKAEAIAKGKLKAQSERVKNGVCPCCKRTVKQLAAHMKTKHPDWSGDDAQ